MPSAKIRCEYIEITNSNSFMCKTSNKKPNFLGLCYLLLFRKTDGQTSTQSRVKSGVPQDTVFGPIMFLLYINDIGQNIRSKIQLIYVDDCILYIESLNPHKTNKPYKKILLKYPTGQTLGI